jgi:hypothetical protein
MEQWYAWFYEHRCGIWGDGGQCPIMQSQRQHVAQSNLRFYPEAIWGSPTNPVWFVPINPGQARANRNAACEISAERRACPNTIDDPKPKFTFERYISRHDLVSTFQQDQHHPVFADRVTSAAFGLLLNKDRVICVDDPDINRDVRLAAVQRLTVLNSAHCKCPSYPRVGVERERLFWRQCGKKNLEAMLHYKPRLVVLFGGPPRNWLWDERPRANAGDAWTLTGWNFYHPGQLRQSADGWNVNLLFLPHPSSRGCYNPGKALHAFNARLTELGISL